MELQGSTFCNSGFKQKELIGIINEFYPIGIDAIEDAYSFLINSFNSDLAPEKQAGYSTIVRSKEDLQGLQEKFFVSDDANYFGIDFPTWLNFDTTSERKRIMVVGIDALRNDEDYMDNIVLGTPYGFHLKALREGRMKNYWNFISKLAEDNSVYLTDTFKLFYYSGNKKLKSSDTVNFHHSQDSSDSRYNQKDIHQIIFKKEVALIQPHLIVTLGHIPRIWFSETMQNLSFKQVKSTPDLSYGSVPILSMPHLSGRSINTAKEFINAESTGDIPPLYAKYVSEYLNNLLS